MPRQLQQLTDSNLTRVAISLDPYQSATRCCKRSQHTHGSRQRPTTLPLRKCSLAEPPCNAKGNEDPSSLYGAPLRSPSLLWAGRLPILMRPFVMGLYPHKKRPGKAVQVPELTPQ